MNTEQHIDKALLPDLTKCKTQNEIRTFFEVNGIDTWKH